MNTRTTAWLALAAALLALLGVACSAPAMEWSGGPVEGEWPLREFIPAAGLADWLDEQHESVLRERRWCRSNAGQLPTGAPLAIISQDAAAQDLERFFDPLGPAETAWIGELAEIVAKERELTLDPPPQVRIISHDNLRTVACHALLHEDQTGSAGDLWQFERILGINHRDWTPSVQSAFWLYGIGGWYSYETETITLVGDLPLARFAFDLMAHELVHAMQDQYLATGIGGLYEDATSDGSTAISWLIEGDAVTAQTAASSPAAAALADTYQWGFGGTWVSDLNGLSPYLAPLAGAAFDAQYTDGAAYVRSQKADGGWQRINELLSDPPHSSEQVLHPDKLASREPPIEAERLAALRRQVFDPREEPSATTMGERYLANLIGLATQSPQLSAEAAAGWGGDELAVWSMVDGRRDTVAIWAIAFDDATEHREGVTGLREWLIAWSEFSAVADPTGRALAYDGPAGAIRVVDSADTAWLVVSTDRRTADRVTARILRLDADPGWWTGAATGPRE